MGKMGQGLIPRTALSTLDTLAVSERALPGLPKSEASGARTSRGTFRHDRGTDYARFKGMYPSLPSPSPASSCHRRILPSLIPTK